MERILALVVSHNRHAQLVNCIEAIRRQTIQPEAILVVNNGSSDYTSVWLDKQEDIIHICQENAGSAGGFAVGLEWAHRYGFMWTWCMDDDGYAADNALEKLLEQKLDQPILINSAVINMEDKKSFVWKTSNYNTLADVKEEVVTGVARPFNGSLIHRKVVEVVGLPKKDLFCRGDEAEYFYRITRVHKIKAVTVTSSIYYHPPRKFSYTKEWTLDTSWSTYYHVRNKLAILSSKYPLEIAAFIAYLFFVVQFVCGILFFQRTQRFRKLAFVGHAFVHAIFGIYKTTPEKIQHKIKTQYTAPLRNMFLIPCRNALSSIFLPAWAEG
jgi:rhamnopyranosyl-N-acetylglucosaminyl-diphospho-decaprenol beta-1,3/1,4-galactofuranosyltransferase